jgi:D-glycero-alpha-D-manno-heptose-7-phosphate kinase
VAVVVEVPVRVCDVGGWTDTWFAGRGRVCSLAVEPGVTIEATAAPGQGAVVVEAVDYGTTFVVGEEPPVHRLLAEAVREAGPVGPLDVRLRVTSSVPPSSSLGTSAAVCVGLIAALDALRGDVRPPAALAAAAHRAESERLGRQSGVQDQHAAAAGGVNTIEVVGYPAAVVRPVALPAGVAAALDERLAHVAYGAPHDSSAVHEDVIAVLEGEGASSPRLAHLRRLAGEAEAAVAAGDLERWGAALTAATDGQAALHPDLVGDAARDLIDAARSCGAAGWKVNGAGGAGGSLSVLLPTAADRERFEDHARQLGHTPLALRFAPHGARVVPL